MIWKIPGIWQVTEGSISEVTSQIGIENGDYHEILTFPSVTDEEGLRILANYECEKRMRSYSNR